MAQNRPRSYSPYAVEAAQLLGELIHIARRERHWTQPDLAERAGISVPTLSRAERGDPGVAIGTVFELASLTGVALFHSDRERLAMDLERARARSTLLPKRVIRPAGDVDDEF
jgi:transcriptional regulator with XRE-family HTH domain